MISNETRSTAERKPITVDPLSKSLTAIVDEIIQQAAAHGFARDVGHCLVGAMLEIRFACALEKHPALRRESRMGDFHVGSTVIEIALGEPDDKHIGQVASIIEAGKLDVWLIVRSELREKWLKELSSESTVDVKRVTLLGINEFIGQNIGEIGGFERDMCRKEFSALVKKYNEDWIRAVGKAGMMIELDK